MSSECRVKAGRVPPAGVLWMASLLVMALCWNLVDKQCHCCFQISLSLLGILWVAEVQLKMMKTYVYTYMYLTGTASVSSWVPQCYLPSQVCFYFIVLWCFKTTISSSWHEFFSFTAAIRSSMGGVAELSWAWFTDYKWQGRLFHRLGSHLAH